MVDDASFCIYLTSQVVVHHAYRPYIHMFLHIHNVRLLHATSSPCKSISRALPCSTAGSYRIRVSDDVHIHLQTIFGNKYTAG
jgi:hypothetical protein